MLIKMEGTSCDSFINQCTDFCIAEVRRHQLDLINFILNESSNDSRQYCSMFRRSKSHACTGALLNLNETIHSRDFIYYLLLQE